MAGNRLTMEQVLSQAVSPLGGTGSLAGEMERLTVQLQRLQSVNEAALESVRTNTQAVQSSGSLTSPGSGATSIGGTLLSGFGMGLGITPLISGVLKLFGGGSGSSTPSPLVKFDLPSSQNVSAGMSSSVPGAACAVDYAQGNLPRPVTVPAVAQQITVQVQAMDSRSFLDHSNDIALAVRQAMLESSVLNDVVREA